MPAKNKYSSMGMAMPTQNIRLNASDGER